MVTTTRAMVSSTEAGMGTPRPISQTVRYSAKLSPAKAAPRKPESVMAIWMVDKKLELSSTMRSSLGASLSPSSSSLRSLLALSEITAISVAAKNALIRIRIT